MGELIGGAFFFSLFFILTFGNPGHGDKIGQVASMTDEGVICTTKTLLVTGKYGGGELKVTVPESRPDLIAEVNKLHDEQVQVKVHFHTNLVAFSCSNDTGNRFLDAIEAHPEGAAK